MRQKLLCLLALCLLLPACNKPTQQVNAVSMNAVGFANNARVNGGIVFADRDHVVGVDVSRWGRPSEIVRLTTSCECVQLELKEITYQGVSHTILVVRVRADNQLRVSSSLAVMIEALRSDGAKVSLSFEFIHVSNSEESSKGNGS